ncbi:acyl carrier protein [Streptomyces leeuwenhoekii]|uniref:Acyl carrier protein n=1 Tax=Streptomyces leeuwenhoekii TaxID=1437453 RepID=A0A0F7VMW5_STRLW|nr:acyl carrier protein [Streptomyces leeuwenhoekii]CQR59498.1 Acyl carrier protein [Streptomyces leeuwenhoekii]
MGVEANQALERRVIETVAKVLNRSVEEVTLESRFQEDLEADSLPLVELLVQVEATFGVDIPDSEASKVRSVRDLVKYVRAGSY